MSGASDPSVITSLLFVANVTPYICKRIKTLPGTFSGKTGNYQISQPTPSMFIARAFNFWRGTMVYRFRVVASSFHRGNLRITYDPISPLQAQDINSQMTCVVDLSEAREVVVRIPWCSQYPYLEVANQLHEPPENYSPSLTTATTNFAYTNYDKTKHNGVVMAAIVNQLVAPNGQPAYLVVSSWMEDSEFQVPSVRISDDYPVFSKPTSGIEGSAITLVSGKQSDKMSSTCFGERITSVRTLLKRVTQTQVLYPPTVGGPTAHTYNVNFTLPSFPQIGYADMTTDKRGERVSYLTYFAPAFTCRRGGVRYMIQWDDAMVASAAAGYDPNFMPIHANYTRSWDAVSPGTAGAINTFGYQLDATRTIQELTTSRDQIIARSVTGTEGSYIANYSTQERFHELEIPDYNGYRFELAQFIPITTVVSTQKYTLTKNPTESGFQLWSCSFRSYGSKMYAPIVFSSAAEDFTLMWFQAAPPLYTYVGT